MNRRLRTLHKWCALTLAAFLLLQVVTGLLLTHREALARFTYSESLAANVNAAGTGAASSDASLDVLVENLHAAVPGARLERIVYPRTPGVLLARLYDGTGRMHAAWLDQATGRVLSAGPFWRYPLEVADKLHVSLALGTTGKVLLFLEALGLSFLAISGVWLWWPKGRRFKPALKVNWHASAARLIRDLHVVPGVLVAVALLACSLAATLLVGEPLIKPLVAMIAPTGPDLALPRLPPVAPGQQASISWQQGLEVLQQRFPDGRLRQMRPFGPQGRMVGVLFVAENEFNPRSHHYAGIDRFTGEVHVLMDASARPAGERFMDWFLPVHSGEIYGAARPVVVTTVGLALLALSITGVLMWWRQRQSLRRSRARQKSVSTTGAGETLTRASIVCFAITVAALTTPRPAHADASTPRYGGEARVAISSDILSTNPGVLRDGNTDTVLYHIGESLVAYRDDLTVGPLLASSVELSDDATVYTFRLRPNVHFHNGAPLTAREVKWSWDRLLDPRTGFRCLEFYDGRGASALKLLAVEIVDDLTVRFLLNKPSALFLDRMANLQCQTPILHPASVGPDGQWRAPIATGPYKLGEWRRGRFVTLERFAQYSSRSEPRNGLTGAKQAYLDRVTFVVVPDRVQAKTSVYAGDIDLAFAVPLSSYAELHRRERQQRDVRVYQTDTLDWTVLLMQSADPLLRDVRMRRAIAHAISGPLVTEASTFGLARYNPSAVQTLSQYHTPQHDAWLTYDPKLAREQAKAAGYRGEPLVIQTNRRFSYMFDNAVAVQAMLVEAGFDARIEVLDWATQLSNFFTGRFQLSSFGFSARSHPALLFGNFIGSKRARTSVQWDDPEARRIMETIEDMKDASGMQAQLDRLYQLMRQQVPLIGLYNDHVIDVSKASLAGYQPWVFGRPRLWGVWRKGGD